MVVNYPAIYRDKCGEENITIQNDGKTLQMTIRGVGFESTFLDDWEPTIPVKSSELSSFQLLHNELCAFSLDFDVSVPVVRNDETLPGNLQVHLELGGPKPNNRIEYETLKLELIVDDESYRSCGKHGWFDDEIWEIQELLPEAMFIKSCYTCAYSDYAPAGYGMFGCMACFRNSKQKYLSLKGKAAYFKLRDKIVEFVQEIHLCPEFEKRIPGTDYRG